MPRNNAPIQQPMIVNNGLSQAVWVKWFGVISRAVNYIRNDGSLEPVSLSDAAAINNSIYYSTDQSKLVYKDSGGTVNVLY